MLFHYQQKRRLPLTPFALYPHHHRRIGGKTSDFVRQAGSRFGKTEFVFVCRVIAQYGFVVVYHGHGFAFIMHLASIVRQTR